MSRTKLMSALLGSVLVIGGVAFAQPKQNISSARHPNLARAEALCSQAYEKIVAAQQANEWDLGGHAAKAKSLLDQVNNELKLAAEQSNKNKAK